MLLSMPSFVIDDDQSAMPESFSIYGENESMEPGGGTYASAPRDHHGAARASSSARRGRRASNILNEDDYDYALELEADSEYRLTAQYMAEVKDFPFEVTASTYSPVKGNGTTAANKNKENGLISSIIAFGSKRFSNLGGKSQHRDGGSMSPQGTPPRNNNHSNGAARSSADVELGRKSTSPNRYNFPQSPSASPKQQQQSRRASVRRSVASPGVPSRRAAEEEGENGNNDNDDYEPSEQDEDRENNDGSLNSDEIEEESSEGTGSSAGDGPAEGDDEQYINDDDEEEDEGDEEEDSEDGNQRGGLHIEQTLKEFGVMSKELFKKKLKLMNQRKKWAQRYSRSSNAFLDSYDSTGKETRNHFLVMLSRGVTVRRHQSGCHAEDVRLYSDDGCITISWEPIKKESAEGESGSQAPRNPMDQYDGNVLDCCVTVCGCGDDDIENPQTSSRMERAKKSSEIAVENTESDDFKQDNQKYTLPALWRNLTFKKRGAVKDCDMLAVHPATKEDPSRPGFLGTDNFRNSRDVYNQALSFSIVSRGSLGTVVTLDIECSDEMQYFLLLSGFVMLCTEVHFRRSKERKEKEQVPLTRMESFKHGVINVWEKYYVKMFPPETQNRDPLDSLFYVTSGVLMPLKFNTLKGEGEDLHVKNFDIVPPSQFLGWNSAGTQIWARLRLAGLEVKCVFSWDLTRVILKLRCPQWRLEEMAEKMHMKLRRRDGTFKRFKRSRRDTFMAAGYNGSLFKSSERQKIIDFILNSKIADGGAELDADTKLGSCIKARFPLHMNERLQSLKHTWVTFWKIEQPGEIASPWSVFDTPLLITAQRVYVSLKWTWDGLLSQPLDSIAEYYGEDVAFYFAWVSFFSRWLVLPSILGFIVFCVQVNTGRMDHWLCIPYAIFIITWSCLLLAFWRQKAAALAHRWGVLDYEVEETERPQFQGIYVYDSSTGEQRKVYPAWKRLAKYMVTYPVVFIFIGCVLALMIVTSTTNQAISHQLNNGEPLDYTPRFEESFGMGHTHNSNSVRRMLTNSTIPEENDSSMYASIKNTEFWIVNLFYPSIYGLITSIAAELFELFAVTLTDFENHQTDSSYWNHMIVKIFSVRFVIVFTTLFYYAFKRNLDSETSYMMIATSIFAFLTVGEWWSKFISIWVPSWIERLRLYRMKSAVVSLRKHIWRMTFEGHGGSKGREVMDRRQKYLEQGQEQCWVEALKREYNTFGDYTELMIQLGLVLLFAAVFPLSPLIVLVNNIFFIRLDAFKLTNTRKRPIAQKSAGLGVWEDILQVMSVAGIITNCMLVGITSSVLPGYLGVYGGVGVAIALFFFEHIVLFFKYMLHKLIPRIPLSLQREILGINNNDGNLPRDKNRRRRGGRRGSINGDERDSRGSAAFNEDDFFDGRRHSSTGGPSGSTRMRTMDTIAEEGYNSEIIGNQRPFASMPPQQPRMDRVSTGSEGSRQSKAGGKKGEYISDLSEDETCENMDPNTRNSMIRSRSFAADRMMPTSSTSEVPMSRSGTDRMLPPAGITRSYSNLPTIDQEDGSSSDSSSSSSEGGTYAIVRSKYLKEIKKQQKLRPKVVASRPPVGASSSSISVASKDLVKTRIAKANSIPLESIMTSNGNVFSAVIAPGSMQAGRDNNSSMSIVESLANVADEESVQLRTISDSVHRASTSVKPSISSQHLPRPPLQAQKPVSKAQAAATHKSKDLPSRVDKDLIARLDMAKAASSARASVDMHPSAMSPSGGQVARSPPRQQTSPDMSQCSFPSKSSMSVASSRKSPANSKSGSKTEVRDLSKLDFFRQAPVNIGNQTSPFGALTSAVSPQKDTSYLEENDRWEDSPVSRMASSSPHRHRSPGRTNDGGSKSPSASGEGSHRRSKSPKRDRSRSPARNEPVADSRFDMFYSSPFGMPGNSMPSFGASPDDDNERDFAEYPHPIRSSQRIPSPPSRSSKHRSPKTSPKKI